MAVSVFDIFGVCFYLMVVMFFSVAACIYVIVVTVFMIVGLAKGICNRQTECASSRPFAD